MYKKSLLLIFFITILYISFKDKVYDNKIINFGMSIPKTGIMKEWGKAVFIGANSYFLYANETNILNNKELKLITYDDKYEPELTYDNLQKLLLNDEMFSLFGFVGTPTVKNILPVLDKSKIPLIAPFTGASFLRAENKTNIINFRSSYKEEIDKTVDYLYKKENIRKFAVFYQSDDYGEEGYISLIKALKKRNLELNGEGTYKRNTLSIRHALHEIKTNKPEAIILVGAYKANALFIKKAKEDDVFKDTIFCNISFGDANEMIKELNYKTNNLIFSQVVPSYNNEKIKVILEYRKIMKKYYPNESLGFISLESYLAAKTMVDALNKIKGSITRNKFLDELKIISSNKNNQLLNRVYLFEYKHSNFKELNYAD